MLASWPFSLGPCRRAFLVPEDEGVRFSTRRENPKGAASVNCHFVHQRSSTDGDKLRYFAEVKHFASRVYEGGTTWTSDICPATLMNSVQQRSRTVSGSLVVSAFLSGVYVARSARVSSREKVLAIADLANQH